MKFMAERKKAKTPILTKADFDAAVERGRIFRETVPHAVAARYDAASGRVIVDLTNGSTFAFFPQYLQDMEHGTPEQFAEVEVLGSGYGLHWESLDADFTVPGLLNGIFGTAKWMAQKAGQTTSLAKAAAARANGAKGGRPRKAA
jgi:Protein of unknown function (DUF2442)